MNVQQSAACPICKIGVQDGPDMDDYAENWKAWHEHLLTLEEQSEAWLYYKKKEPIVTHKVSGMDMVHWLCRECLYRHNPVTGVFNVKDCPICHHEITTHRVVCVAGIDEFAHEDIIDTFAFDVRSQDDDSDDSLSRDSSSVEEDPREVGVYIAGYASIWNTTCILANEVLIQNTAYAAGQDITNPSVFTVFTRVAPYTICGGDRKNWAVQFLEHSVELLEPMHPIPRHDWTEGSFFGHAVAAGRYILAGHGYGENGTILSPLLDFAPGGKHAVQIQNFQSELQHEDSEHNLEVYASASVFFLTTIITELFAADQQALTIFNNLARLHTQHHLSQPDFTRRDYVKRVFILLDNIIQQYNVSVYPNCVYNHESIMREEGGMIQNIIAPRPWVIMQIIQLEQTQSYHDEMGYDVQNRCVSEALRSQIFL